MGRKRKNIATRSIHEKKFCGMPSPLEKTEPPTTRQVIQYSYFLKNSQPCLKEYDIAKVIADDVIEIWKAVNPRLPLYDKYYIVKLVNKACFKKAKKINWKSLASAQALHLERKLDRLFDISACKCDLPIQPCDANAVKCTKENCNNQHIVCLCPQQIKVPLEERQYLKDQREKIGPKGSFQLGPVDMTAVKRDQKAADAKERFQAQHLKQKEDDFATFASTSSQEIPIEDIGSNNFSNSDEKEEDDEFRPAKQPSGAYSYLKTPRYAMELVRSDVSSNIGASLANAFLLDLRAMDLLKPGLDISTIIVDKSKIDREKNRVKVKTDQRHKENTEKLLCIGVDGKVDRETLLYSEVNDEEGVMKLKKGKGPEHHLTFTKESGTECGTYLTHRTVPLTGATGVRLGEEVHSVLEEFNSVQTVKAILLDNTSINTGSKGGLVTSLEKNIGKKLHIIGCSLHQNELPFRAVFKHLDGTTRSPTTFSGPLGKLCEKDIHHLPQVEFENISGELDDMKFPEETLKDLSSDQRLLYEYVIGISQGQVNPKYAAWKIGPLNHARWLTLAIRLMCMWTRGSYPARLNDKLQQLVQYIVQVYAVNWFEIKRHSKFHHQQEYIFNTIRRIKVLSSEVQATAFNNLKYNAFALLPENVLYSMIKSDETEIRESALRKILSIR